MDEERKKNLRMVTIDVIIDAVLSPVEPLVKESPCVFCKQGMHIYDEFPLSSTWNGNHLEIGKVNGWKCENCDSLLLPNDVATEIGNVLQAEWVRVLGNDGFEERFKLFPGAVLPSNTDK